MASAVRKISVIGDGGWGTTLALYLDAKGYDVLVWGAFPDYARQVAQKRENVKFLPGIKISKRIVWVSDLSLAIAHADLIVSWNFRHIVHFDKIRGFNAVNLQEGYPLIDIRSPKEVI